MFSIIIPTYNNLNYLKICCNSLKKNSDFKNELILHINDGSDGSLEYAKSNNIKFTFSKDNIGLCSSVNLAAKKSTTNFILYAHDDMYFCPEWDKILKENLDKLNTKLFYLSASMIERNSGHIKYDCGSDYNNFDEKKLLENFKNFKSKDFQGSHWAPHLIHKEIWEKIGGFSEEFNPGVGSDPDLNMKLWKIGVRLFKGIGNCRVYHFSSLTLRKKVSNNGAKTFLLKWGITIKFFKKYYLRANEKFTGPLSEPNKNIFFYINYLNCKISYIYHLLFSKKT